MSLLEQNAEIVPEKSSKVDKSMYKHIGPNELMKN